MGLTEAIAAAQTAGHSSPQAISDWLSAATQDTTNSEAMLGHSQVVEVLGLQATAALLAGLEAASATNGVAKTVLTLLTTSGYVKPGSGDIAASLTAFVSAGLLTQVQANSLHAYGLRPVYRYETFGLAYLPTVRQIQRGSL